jgi:addiction module HigA family antidote
MAEYRSRGPDPKRQPVHPGAVLREDVLPALRLSIAQAAKAMGITRQSLHGIVTEQHGVSPEMALRLGRFCGDGAAIWLRLQQRHDLWLAEQKLGAELARIPTMRAA